MTGKCAEYISVLAKVCESYLKSPSDKFFSYRCKNFRNPPFTLYTIHLAAEKTADDSVLPLFIFMRSEGKCRSVCCSLHFQIKIFNWRQRCRKIHQSFLWSVCYNNPNDVFCIIRIPVKGVLYEIFKADLTEK